MNQPETPLPAGARIGTTLGVCGWAIGLAVACLATGEHHLLLTLALPGLGLSLVLAALALAVIQRQRRASGPRRRPWAATAGVFALVLAVLAAFLRTWVLPAVLRSPRLRDVLVATSSATSIPWPVIAGLVAAGAALLLCARLRHR